MVIVMGVKLELDNEIKEKLRIYRALDNEIRLKILVMLYNHPNITFSDLAKLINLEKGLLAYHLGVLKNVGLVNCKYKRKSKKLSEYNLTRKGKKVVLELISKQEK